MEKLIVVKGQLEGREFDLGGNSVTIGRDERRDITLPESLVSRQHATLDNKTDGWHVTDNGSANGTSVNGNRLDKDTAQRLFNGDRVEIGSFVLQFVASTESVAAPVEDDKTMLLGDDLPAPAPPPAAPKPPPPPAPRPAPKPAPPPAAKPAPPPPPPPPAAKPAPLPAPPPPAAGQKGPVKVDSTIYISDDIPPADFAAFGAPPAGGKPGAAGGQAARAKGSKGAAAAKGGKSKLGLIIGIIFALLFFFFASVCGLGFLAYKKGWGPFARPDFGQLTPRQAPPPSTPHRA